MYSLYYSKEWNTEKLNEMIGRESKHSDLSRNSLEYLGIFFSFHLEEGEKTKPQIETVN